MPLSPSLLRAKRWLYVFVILYGLVSMVLYLMPLIFLNYATSFQMSTLSMWNYIAATLFFLLAFYRVMNSLTTVMRRHGFLPKDDTEAANEWNKVQEAAIMKAYRLAFVLVILAVILLTYAIFFYAYNLINILFIECPRHDVMDHTSDVTMAIKGNRFDATRQQKSSTLDIVLSYRNMNKTYPDLLHLKYNLTDAHIIWHEHDTGQKTWRERETIALKSEQQALCTSDLHAPFHFLESEIQEALRKTSDSFSAKQSFWIRGTSHSSQTSPVEDAIKLESDIRRICRNETGFAAFILIFLGAIFLLNIILCAFFIHIYRRHS